MKMNIKKTKTMVVRQKKLKSDIPKVKIHLDSKEVEHVSKFVHLRELITENGKSE